MKRWKDTGNGSTAVLLEGARRVGKSYIAKRFGENEYESCLFIDFSNISKQMIGIFEDDSADLDTFFMKLSVFYGIRLYPRKSLIVFDEVQMYPPARQLVKHLVADGRYDYLETGSLVTLKQNVENIVIPSEEEHLKMYPLDFEEFLWAMGDEITFPYIQECFEKRKEVGEAIHRKTMNVFRQYMLAGGIPAQLSRHEKKYSLASIQKEARFREYEDAFIWLDEAMIINTCFNTADPSVGLSLNTERMTLKCYMADSGLLFSHAFSDTELTEESVYKAILFDRIGLNEGMFLENMVAQMLKSKGYHLFFYSRSDRENPESRMEVDFLIRKKNRVCPIEVKSAAFRRHVSLDKFRQRFPDKTGECYVICTRDLLVENHVVYLPFYMALCL